MKESFEIETHIANHLLLLKEMTDEVLNTLENYVNDFILLQHGIISYRILFPEQLLHELSIISSKFTLPISLNIENVYLYYKIMNLKSFLTKDLLIIAFEIPLASLEKLDIYHMLSLPTPHKNDNTLFSYIEPSKSFLLISHMRTSYLMVDTLANCEEYHPKEWICKKMPTLRKTDAACEVQLISAVRKSIPKSCNTRNLTADAEIWHEIDNNLWLFSVSTPTQLTVICDEDPLKNEVIKQMGTLELNQNCKAFTNQVNLETNSILMSTNSSFEIPSTNIVDDDCCEKLKENITLNSIHLEPLKFTQINLHELKYAQHKLSEFDEQLQQQLNKPFVIQHSSWLQTIILGLITLIIGYNILKWCGFLQFLRRYLCCTKEPRAIEGSPCFQIFNQCCTTPVEQPIPVLYDVELERLNYPKPSTSRPSEDAISTGSQSMRRSKRLQGIKINPL
ncbi:uncharacterized protein LOC123671733 [Harmonia axyridis]|uniref:uncharacterized protein LOC123671733 n=1 Tax=Harmonia axyridis TaxID=115357 RepID=UPI001E27555E|nr:uncharacterized protein LOC123671733 [Harmonia axyridis]XP_045461684.1 uncharacterized protein LOC123671733 [Harmonia axyridis]XP_045461685.1 uncharacterized protein LOC123671733 [Harmonia axyridis]